MSRHTAVPVSLAAAIAAIAAGLTAAGQAAGGEIGHYLLVAGVGLAAAAAALGGVGIRRASRE